VFVLVKVPRGDGEGDSERVRDTVTDFVIGWVVAIPERVTLSVGVRVFRLEG
jgi:hypothetical protein